MNNPVSRRSFLENMTMATTGIAVMSSVSVANAFTLEDKNLKGYNPYASAKSDMRTSIFNSKIMTITGKIYDRSSLTVIPNATVEVWHLSPNSTKYRHRAKLRTDEHGTYKFITDFPNNELGKMPRIHFKVTSGGSSYCTHLLFNDFGAYILSDHWEKNHQLNEKVFPKKEVLFDHSTIKFNVTL